MSESVLYDERQARARLGGLGRSKFWELIRTGQLVTVKIGSRRFVPASALASYIDGLVAEQGRGR